jgi:glutathione S-transferase
VAGEGVAGAYGGALLVDVGVRHVRNVPGSSAAPTSPQLPEELHSKPQADLARKELEKLLTILDARLAKHGNILGKDFSLADLIVASVVGYGVYLGASVDGHAHVKAWLAAFQGRRSYKAIMGG